MSNTATIRPGALWAKPESGEPRLPMKAALIGALVIEALIVLAVARVDFSGLADRPELKLIRATLYDPPVSQPERQAEPETLPLPPLPPPPPPPPETRTITRQSAPALPSIATPLPLPIETPTQIAPAAQPAPDAPAVASVSPSLSGPAGVGSGSPSAVGTGAGTGTGADGRGGPKGVDCPVQVKPVYPIAARRDGLTGVTVVARLFVDTAGKVTDVRIVSVDPPTRVFNGAVIAAARQYQCAKRSTPYDFPLTIVFNLEEEQ